MLGAVASLAMVVAAIAVLWAQPAQAQEPPPPPAGGDHVPGGDVAVDSNADDDDDDRPPVDDDDDEDEDDDDRPPVDDDDDDAPIARDDAYSMQEDGLLVVDAPGVLGNDLSGGGPLTMTLVSGPNAGALEYRSDGSFRYTPLPNFNGLDSFQYRAKDASGQTSSPAFVRIEISPANDPPVATDDAADVAENSSVTINVLANDDDPDGDPLQVTGGETPANGTVTFSDDGIATYTPNRDFSGTDSFSYTVTDGNGGFDTATVTVTVTRVNDPPLAGDDAATTPEDTAVIIGVASNDSDPDGDVLTSSVGAPANGTAVLQADGSVLYTPNTNFNGTDTFTYTVTDPAGDGDTATVTVTVTAVNDPPVASDDGAATDEDTAVLIAVLANDTDADGDQLFPDSTTQPANGTVTRQGDGRLRYAPNTNFNGADTFTYTVRDGNGGFDTATVTVIVRAINDTPVAANDAYSTGEGVALTVPAPGVLSNDTDVDGDPLRAARVSGPSGGTLTLNLNGSFTYTPAAGFAGTDTFTYRATDPAGASATATVTITVVDRIPAGCTITGTPGDETLTGTAGNDVICGLGGNDTINGLGGNDTIYAGSGNDVIDGGAGADTIFADAGDDDVTGGSGNDIITGGLGADRLDGGAGNDDLRAQDGVVDIVIGGSGTDTATRDPIDNVTSVP